MVTIPPRMPLAMLTKEPALTEIGVAAVFSMEPAWRG